MKWLSTGAAICGIASAIAWFVSSWLQPYSVLGTFLTTPEDDAAYDARCKLAGRWNSAAALLTGVASLLGGLATWVS